MSNAFVKHVAPAHETTREQWNRQLAVCLDGTFFGIRAYLEGLHQQRGGVVIVSSVHPLVGLPCHPAYAAAEGGLTALARQLAVEYGPAVRVSSAMPPTTVLTDAS